ncbi:MAG: elongation factor P [Clostridia bacterium]|nr:elongation factor P [Clostridia bacterium]
MGFILAGDFRKGVTFELDGNVMTIVDFQHVKPGKGAAFVRTKIKNVMTGAVLERTFNPTDKFETALIERKDMQYSYTDGEFYYFMDLETFDLIPLNYDICQDALNFIVDQSNVTVSFYKGKAFLVEPETFVVLQITVCEPAVRGDTATNGTKPATLETGYKIQVPMFVNEGDYIRVDTRDGAYMERVKK